MSLRGSIFRTKEPVRQGFDKKNGEMLAATLFCERKNLPLRLMRATESEIFRVTVKVRTFEFVQNGLNCGKDGISEMNSTIDVLDSSLFLSLAFYIYVLVDVRSDMLSLIRR